MTDCLTLGDRPLYDASDGQYSARAVTVNSY